MEKSDVYHPPKYSLKQRVWIFLSLIIFLSAIAVVVYFHYVTPISEIASRGVIVDTSDSFPDMNYEVVYATRNESLKSDMLTAFTLDTAEIYKVESTGFIEEPDFLRSKIMSNAGKTEVVSHDGTMFVEVSPGDFGDIFWLNNLWEANKAKLFEFPVGIHPILIGFSEDNTKLYYDMFDITGVPAGLLIVFDIETRTIQETIFPLDLYDRATTPVLSPDGRYSVSSAWKKQGEFASATYQSVLLLRDFRRNATVTIQRGPNFIFGDIVWAPDSRSFVFSQYQPREGKEYELGIWSYNVQSKQFRKLNPVGRPVLWTPDGRYVIFTSVQETGIVIGSYDNKEGFVREITSGLMDIIVYWGVHRLP